MKKKTIVIVSLTLVLAILAVAVIATFPTYLFEDTTPGDSSVIQSGNIVESEGESSQGDDVGVLGGEDDNGGAQAVLPTVDDEELGYSEIPESELETIAEAKNVKVLAETGAFEDETKVKIKKLGILDKSYYRARYYLKGIAEEFTAYNLSAKKDGNAVLPNGTVKLSFTIPENYDSKNVAVYYLLDKGVQEIDCKISEDGKTATVKISQTGVYILVEKVVSSENEEDASSENTSNSLSNSTSNSSDVNSNQNSNTGNDNTGSDNTGNDNTGSDNTGSDDTTSDSNTSSDNTSSVDPNKESMNGWTPWH